MSEERNIRFVSQHASLTIIRKPIDTTRMVNGVMSIVKEDRPPFKFESGSLRATEEEAKEIRKSRTYGTLFEELPAAVERVTRARSVPKPAAKPTIPPADPKPAGDVDPATGDTDPSGVDDTETDENIVLTEIPNVKNFNQARDHLKDNFGLEHKDVNSKAKVFEHAKRLAITFPNYPDEEEQE